MSTPWIVAIALAPVALGVVVAVALAVIYAVVSYSVWVVDRREAGILAKRPSAADLVRFNRILFGEVLAAAVFFFLHPLGMMDPPPPRSRELGGRRPILLVHGFAQARSNFWLLGLRLAAEGLGPLYAVNLRPMSKTLQAHAASLSRMMEEVMQATGATEVDVVAHSMGGIVARLMEASERSHPRRVRRLVTIGTPRRGTRVAELAVSQSGVELRPQSKALGSMPKPPPGMIVAISSAHDNVVVPPENAQIGDGGRDVTVEGVGHLAMLLDAGVAVEVAKALGEDIRSADRVLPPLPQDGVAVSTLM